MQPLYVVGFTKRLHAGNSGGPETRGVSFKSQSDVYDMRLLANIDRGVRTAGICPVKTQPRFDESGHEIETVGMGNLRKFVHFLDLFGKAL